MTILHLISHFDRSYKLYRLITFLKCSNVYYKHFLEILCIDMQNSLYKLYNTHILSHT